MAYHRESFSSTSSSSSSLYSFSTQTPPRSGSRKQGPSTQKLKLKRWFSSHLLSPRQPSDPTTVTATSNTTTATTTANTLIPDNIPTTTAQSSKLSRKSSASQSHSQSSSSLGIKPHQDPICNHNPEHNYNNPISYRDERTIHIQTEYTSPNDPLSDSYAAFCRAFTSSPSPEHQRQKRIPLPRLPASSPDNDNLEIETETEFQRQGIERTAGTAEHELGSGAPFATGSAIASAAETSLSVRDDRAAPSASPAIRFLPVGAHGYLPAGWALPRPPTPPPGILTPERYQEMQRTAEEEKENEKKDKRDGGRLTWCLPIRVSWAPWGRPKEP
ncbi:hypothetical protein BJX68DRAFT_144800 [Aspergillus pseudodeflectus]|uniref:Uncharacterized protein n=1 Tax=Aspergillus pseudodeflectus TaxID=176178 RepID=A0ABR4L3T7_9EURO